MIIMGWHWGLIMRKIRNIPRGALRRLNYILDKSPQWVTALRHKIMELTQINICDYGPGNTIGVERCSIHKIKVVFLGSNNVIMIEPKCRIERIEICINGSGNVILFGGGTFVSGGLIQVFGDNSRMSFHAGCWAVSPSIHMTDSNSELKIGEGTMLGPACELRCGDGHALYDTSNGRIINRAKYIHIGDRVWAGGGVLFLKNIVVGDGAVVGARSVVTKDLAPNTLAVGVPAKVIRENVGWTRQRIDEFNGDFIENYGA